MTLLAWGVAGLVAGLVAWAGLRSTLDGEAFQRTNFRGRALPTAGGLVVVVASLAVEAVRAVAFGTSSTAAAVVVTVTGFGLLGLVDDLAGEQAGAGGDRGFRGHLGALSKGRLTTGGLKLVGGIAVSVVVASLVSIDDGWRLLVVGAVIALAANLGNLFDRAPGRTAKVGVVALLAVVVFASAGAAAVRMAPLATAAGVAASIVWPDLRERFMLGDTGANVIGALAGLAVVAAHGTGVLLATAVVLLVLNGVSEVVSFSRIIERVPPLRILDRAGRLP